MNHDPRETRTEHSAGVVLCHHFADGPKALLIRVRRDVFEIPKGHLEPGETAEQAALRELREETGVKSRVQVGVPLSDMAYEFVASNVRIRKIVKYFSGVVDATTIEWSAKPKRTRELRWVEPDALASIPWVSPQTLDAVKEALDWFGEAAGSQPID